MQWATPSIQWIGPGSAVDSGAPRADPLDRRRGPLHPGRRGRARDPPADHFDIVWATGWEQRANEHLPFLLGLPFGDLPCLTFGGRAVFGSAHWKLDAIQEYAGDRPAAWLDDSVDDTCHEWARGVRHRR
jgi:hypothetical protein